MSDTHMILVKDQEQRIEAANGQTVLDALLENGVMWQYSCGMQCACTTCAVQIEHGADNLSDMTADERITLKRFRGPRVLDQPVRLACQATVHGDIAISKPDWC